MPLRRIGGTCLGVELSGDDRLEVEKGLCGEVVTGEATLERRR
ncbi:4053_t:CDS:2 [Entrophospora sp. SA101]|nr:4053_t:CDS:2 [Entrophospora sp. SA101]